MKLDFLDVEAAVRKHFGSEIVRSVTAGLALIASLSLKDRPHCLSLIYLGPSGTGKSVSVEAFMTAGDPETKKYLYRADNFTAASFVSHSANKTQAQLKKIDLLPRVKNRTMLTKELSPLFRSDEKEMQKNFSVLTSVLDGKGFVSDSGSQGERGYETEHIFNWLGATTPFPDRTYKLMGHLGNRLLFYELGTDEPITEENLIDFAEKREGGTKIREVQQVVNNFIKDFFEQHPVNTVNMSGITTNRDVNITIVHYAKLLIYGRVVVTQITEDSDFVGEAPEGPYRVIQSLQMLALGSVLIHGRSEVKSEDLFIVRHIVFSSIPERRRRLLQLLLASGGALDVPTAASSLRISRQTVTKYMMELGATGIVNFISGNPAKSTPGKITVADDWQWLLKDALGGGCQSVVVDDNTALSTPPVNDLGLRAFETN